MLDATKTDDGVITRPCPSVHLVRVRCRVGTFNGLIQFRDATVLVILCKARWKVLRGNSSGLSLFALRWTRWLLNLKAPTVRMTLRPVWKQLVATQWP